MFESPFSEFVKGKKKSLPVLYPFLNDPYPTTRRRCFETETGERGKKDVVGHVTDGYGFCLSPNSQARKFFFKKSTFYSIAKERQHWTTACNIYFLTKKLVIYSCHDWKREREFRLWRLLHELFGGGGKKVKGRLFFSSFFFWRKRGRRNLRRPGWKKS